MQPTETWPALIAAVTDLDGTITGVHRTWLDPSGRDKAPIDSPRRAMGHLLGQGRPLRRGERRHGGWRRHRDHAVAPMRHAHHADGGGTLGRASRRHPVPGNAAPPLHRPRRRSGGDGAMASLIDRANEAGIEAITLSPTARRLQRGSAHARHRCAAGSASGCRSLPRMSRASWNWRREPERRDEARTGARFHVASDRGASRLAGESRAHGLLRGRSGRQTARPGNGGWPTIFRRRRAAFTSRGKIAGPRHPPLRFGRSLRSAVQVRSAPPPFVATKAAMGAADPTKGSTHDDRTRRHRL